MTKWSRRLALGLLSWIVMAGALAGQAPQPGAASVGVTLTGSVVDPALAPLAGVVVTLERDGHTVATSTTDANGRFTMASLQPGDYRVRAERAGLPTVTRDLHVPKDARALTLPLVMGRVDAPSKTEDQASRQPPAPAPLMAPPNTNGGRAGGAGGGGGRSSTVIGLPQSTISVTIDGVNTKNRLATLYGGSQWDDPRFAPLPSGETYAAIDANRFQPAREHPLSTFGADVDTASYSNIRRFLSSGQLPPRDAVRIEELVNYFRFAYPAPRDGRPIGMTTEIGDCPWAPSHKLVLIGARAAAASTSREIGGRNIVLLIDVSGSMEPQERLPLIKTALGLFIDTLRPDDTISIVTYAGTSGIALEPTAARNRDRIQSAIARLSAGGSTNGGAGLITAYRIAREAFVPGGVNRVILATDGDFNVGIVGQTDLLHLIENERDSGVFLSVFGVGRDNLKDRTMEMLADHGNGHYAYLDSLQEARRVLIRESDATLETVAKDVKFQVEFNPAIVSAWKLLGYEKREMAARDFNNDRKDGGEMGAGQTVTVLYEVVPVGAGGRESVNDTARPDVDPLKYQPSPAAPRTPVERASPLSAGEWLTVKARYKLPEGETSDELTQVARPGGRLQALPFAAAVAEFGLILRDDPRNEERWSDLANRVDGMTTAGQDAAERAAFRDLIATARGLARLR